MKTNNDKIDIVKASSNMITDFNRVTDAIINALNITLNDKKSSDLLLEFDDCIQRELKLKEGDTCLIYALCNAINGNHEQAMQDVKDYMTLNKQNNSSD